MKVKFLVSMAGHSHTWNPDDEVDLPAKEARSLIAAGFAEAIAPPASAPQAAVQAAVAKGKAAGLGLVERMTSARRAKKEAAAGVGRKPPADPAA